MTLLAAVCQDDDKGVKGMPLSNSPPSCDEHCEKADNPALSPVTWLPLSRSTNMADVTENAFSQEQTLEEIPLYSSEQLVATQEGRAVP